MQRPEFWIFSILSCDLSVRQSYDYHTEVIAGQLIPVAPVVTSSVCSRLLCGRLHMRL